MKIKNLIKKIEKELKENKIEDYYTISKMLLKFELKKDRQYLINHCEEEIDKQDLTRIEEAITKLINGTPIQYITHNQEFMKLIFFVDEDVLIPQPDTEILVEKVLDICNLHYKNSKIKILDLCTGSGAIAISLDKYVQTQNKEIYASDISTEAIKIALKNNKNNNTNVNFIQSDMFESIISIINSEKEEKKFEQFDIIVSNPPYIKTDIIKTLSEDVKKEPEIALDGGIDGLEFYKIIAKNAYKYINNDGYLCLEIGYDQKNEVIKLLSKYPKYNNIQVSKDLSGNDRCIIAKIKK